MLGTNSNSSSSSFPKIGAHPFFHPRVGRYIRFSVPFLASKPLSLVLHTPKGYIRFLFFFFFVWPSSMCPPPLDAWLFGFPPFSSLAKYTS